MSTRITMQDIAESLDISRNTVSKVLNNHSNVSQTTRKRVIDKAIEMKYKGFNQLQPSKNNISTKVTGNVALVTRSDINMINFYSDTLTGLQEEISSNGFNLILDLVKPEEINENVLPQSIVNNNVDGIICIEIFDEEFVSTLLDTNIPTIFLDAIPNTKFKNKMYDIILMENEYLTFTLTNKMISNGHKKIGFVGDKLHCKSFFERWEGYQRALRDSNIPFNPDTSIILEDNNPYLDYNWMKEKILGLKEIPTAFVCANDEIAITVVKVLKELNFSIPADIEVTGFDNITNSEVIEPALTTVHTFKYELGIRAAELLLNRIEKPQKLNEIIHIATEIIYRGTTK